MKKDNRLYYIICVAQYSYCVSQVYRIITNKHTERYINESGQRRYCQVVGKVHLEPWNETHAYVNYADSYYKFDTFEEAMDKAIELVRSGMLPNLGISKKIAEYGNTDGVIAILKRPLGDVIGYRYAKYLEDNEGNKDIQVPKFKNGDTVYLTNIGDGDIIYKTKVYDCEYKDGKWYYYTTYWEDYGYTDPKTEEEFKKYYQVLPSGRGFYGGHYCKVVEC